MESREYVEAEEVLRLFASAVNAMRLYPPSSDLPASALARFAQRTAEATSAHGALRFFLDPHTFRIGETPVASGHSQVATLAEALHAMQIGQLVIAPEMTLVEAESLVRLAGTDPKEVLVAGGPRAVLTEARAANVAVIEVSLRSSGERGLPGVDLLSAPLEEIATEVVGATERWKASAEGGSAIDESAQAIGGFEQATRDIAASRVVAAMMLLTEEERVGIFTAALHSDSSGAPMRGMLEIIGRMSSSSLARLLRVTANASGTTPDSLAFSLNLPPDLAREIGLLLAPSPRSEADSGVPADPNVARLAADATAPGGEESIEHLKADARWSTPGRALATTVAVLRSASDEAAIEAVGAALGPAAMSGALTVVREALRALDEVSSADHSLVGAVTEARLPLTDPDLLTEVCRAVQNDADAAITGELLAAAGACGADILLTHYARSDDAARSLMRPVLRGMSEQVIASAARRLRNDDCASAIGILSALPDLGERQSLALIQKGLEHLDVEVRRAAVSTLASLQGPDARRALAKTLGHWDPETRRWVIREVGRVRAAEAIPPLVRILEDINVLERNHELKKEVIKCLESIGSRDALPVLERWTRRRFVIGRKNKELRYLARRAVERLASDGQATQEEAIHRD